MKNAKRLSRKIIHQSDWVNLFLDRVEYPAGRIAETHYCIDMPRKGVGAIVLNEKKEILLIRSYRYIVNTVDWEVPAGSFKEEDVCLAAEREVLEETGYQSSAHEVIYQYYPLTGMSNSTFYIVKCQALEKIQDFDRNEVHEIAWFSAREIKDMIKQNKIKDGFSLQAILFYLIGF
jgi:8-oxo-dGTP pyrophosphatase MutT (NUDIX family)